MKFLHNSIQFLRKQNPKTIVLSVILFGFAFRLFDMFSIIGPNLKAAYQWDANYDQRRMRSNLTRAFFEARDVIPENAQFEMSRGQWNPPRLSAKYILYPRKLNKEWDYFLDLDGNIVSQPTTWSSLTLPSGPIVYAQKGHGFVKNSKLASYYSLPKLLALIIFVSLINILVGFVLCLKLKISKMGGGSFWFLSTCYLIGLQVIAMIVWLLMILGLPLGKPLLILVYILLISFAIKEISKEKEGLRVQLQKEIRSFCNKVLLIERNMLPNKIFAFFIVIVFTSIAFFPVFDWDAMSHWIMKAKIFFHAQTLDFSYTHVNLYPILWPIHIALQFVIQGSDYDAVANWSTAILFLAFIGQFVGSLRLLKIQEKWLWVPLMLFITCFFRATFYYASAENIFLVYLLGMVAASLQWIHNPKEEKYFYIIMIFYLGLSLVKLEGLPSALIVLASLMAIQRQYLLNGKLFKRIGILSIPILSLLGWILWIKMMGYFSPTHFRSVVTFEKLYLLLYVVFTELLTINVYYVVLAYAVVFIWVSEKRKWTPPEYFLIWTFLGLAIFSGISTLGAEPDNLSRQIDTVTPRLFLHAAPLLTLWWGSRFYRKEQ